MSVHRYNHNPALEQLLELAGGRYDLLERVIVECTREAGGNPPQFSAVVAKLQQLARENRDGSRQAEFQLAG